MRAGVFGCVAAALSLLFTTGDAFGQQKSDLSQARELATKGYAALDASDYATAEDLFRRAEALYHAPTILLGLARAEAHTGKYVEAWEDYHRIIVGGAPPTAPAAIRAAIDSAKQEIGSVEDHRAKATISVVGPSQPTVTLDGVPLATAALGFERFVNPGRHVVHASASGWKDAEVTFTSTQGAAADVKVSLEPVPPSTAAAPAEAAKAAQGSGPAAPAPPAAQTPSAGTSHANTWRTVGWVAASAGGVGLVVGAVSGAVAMSKRSSATQSPCAGAPCPQGQASVYDSNVDDFHTFGTASTIGFVVGGVLAAGGVVLILASHGEPSREVAVTPYLGAGDVGVAGRF